MKTVMRGNKQLHISDDRLEGYKTLGYVEIDPETGAPINSPVDPATLRKEHVELEAENAELEAENADLTAKLAEATAYAETADKTIADLTAGAKDPAGKK